MKCLWFFTFFVVYFLTQAFQQRLPVKLPVLSGRWDCDCHYLYVYRDYMYSELFIKKTSLIKFSLERQAPNACPELESLSRKLLSKCFRLYKGLRHRSEYNDCELGMCEGIPWHSDCDSNFAYHWLGASELTLTAAINWTTSSQSRIVLTRASQLTCSSMCQAKHPIQTVKPAIKQVQFQRRSDGNPWSLECSRQAVVRLLVRSFILSCARS